MIISFLLRRKNKLFISDKLSNSHFIGHFPWIMLLWEKWRHKSFEKEEEKTDMKEFKAACYSPSVLFNLVFAAGSMTDDTL